MINSQESYLFFIFLPGTKTTPINYTKAENKHNTKYSNHNNYSQKLS